MFHVHSIARDKKFIPHGILHYVTNGQTYEETLASILRSCEKNPKLFPRVHADEVQFWYNSFKNGNFDLNQEPTCSPRSKLENLPVLDHVIHSVGAADQQALRRVSKLFKNLIDGENRVYEKVELRMCKDSIMLQVKDGIELNTCRTIYKKKEAGCEITKDKKKTESTNGFMESAIADFQKVVEMIHTKIKKLIIYYNYHRVEETDRELFIKSAAGVLNSLKEPIYVENLNVTIKTPNELDSILKALKPGVLTSLDFTAESQQNEGEEGEGEGAGEANIEEAAKTTFKIKEAPSWSLHSGNLRDLNAYRSAIDLKIEDIVHIPRVFIEIADTMTPEKVATYKDMLLQQKDLKRHWVHDSHSFDEDRFVPDVWRDAMQPFELVNHDFDDNENKLCGTIPYPNESGDVLKFTIHMGVMFERKSAGTTIED